MNAGRARVVLVAVVAGLGLAGSLCLIGAAVWFHYSFDPLLRIPFVLLLGGSGAMLGLGSVGYFIARRSG
jgi:hypothetical protein